MTKEEKIKEAWVELVGDANFLKLRLNENGFSDWRCKQLMPNTSFDLLYDKIKSGAKYPFSGRDLIYRPKTIRNIDDNNGWYMLDSAEDLPDRACLILVISKVHGGTDTHHYRPGDAEYILNLWSHYKLADTSKPLY